MDANELRALADALHWVQYTADWQACDQAADYLRAQADAQPVAVPAGWKWVPVEPTPEMLSAAGMMDGYDWHAPGCSPDADHANWYSAMIAAAPAAPQAEPIDPHMIVAEDRFPDAQVEPKPTPASGDDLNVYREMADSYRNDAQAEPKRSQPLLDLLAVIHCDGGDHTEAVGIERSIKNAQDAVCALKVRLALAEPKRDWTAVDAAIREYLDDYELIGEDDAGADACYTPTERELYLIYDAITGLLADESFVAAISAPQAEPKREPTCLWSRADDDTDVWETSCGHAFTIIEGTPSDNHMEFCCYCGRRVDEEIGGSDE